MNADFKMTQAEFDALDVQEYKKPINGFTHWCKHPETGDPMPMVIHKDDKKNVAFIRIPDAVIESCVKSATGSNQFMFCMFRFESPKVHLDRVTLNFPRGEFEIAEQLLQKANERDNGPLADTPIERATDNAEPGKVFNPVEELKKRGQVIGQFSEKPQVKETPKAESVEEQQTETPMVTENDVTD